MVYFYSGAEKTIAKISFRVSELFLVILCLPFTETFDF